MKNRIEKNILSHLALAELVQAEMIDSIAEAGKLVTDAIRSGGKLLLCGNGGSAADAQHIAAEFVGRFIKERSSLAAIALTTDTSALTAIGNDYGFEKVFSRQVEGLGSAGDVLLAISTSGNSPNVLAAVEAAKLIGCKSIALTGKSGGSVGKAADISLAVPSIETPRIQEMHILIGHIICELVDDALCD